MTRINWLGLACVLLFSPLANAKEKNAALRHMNDRPTLAEVRAKGLRQSSLKHQQIRNVSPTAPKPRLDEFRGEIQPLLNDACVSCHGGDIQESDFRVDTLDPNLISGDDVDWWLEVVDVISNGEMPPEGEAKLTDESRGKIVDWLSSEIQLASLVRRSELKHSSFRRMTRYEYNYALQDLLGLSYEFAQDLPPETASVDGFTNSSEVLQMSVMQFESYRELSRRALQKAIVRESQPEPLYWGISMEHASAKLWRSHDSTIKKLKEQYAGSPEKLERALQNHAKSMVFRPSFSPT